MKKLDYIQPCAELLFVDIDNDILVTSSTGGNVSGEDFEDGNADFGF